MRLIDRYLEEAKRLIPEGMRPPVFDEIRAEWCSCPRCSAANLRLYLDAVAERWIREEGDRPLGDIIRRRWRLPDGRVVYDPAWAHADREAKRIYVSRRVIYPGDRAARERMAVKEVLHELLHLCLFSVNEREILELTERLSSGLK